jgi:hypothetical protein
MKVRSLVTGIAVAAVAIIQNPSVVVAQQQNIVEVASGNDNFETLVQPLRRPIWFGLTCSPHA